MCPRGHDAKTSASEHLTSPFLLRCPHQGRVTSSSRIKMIVARSFLSRRHGSPCGWKSARARFSLRRFGRGIPR